MRESLQGVLFGALIRAPVPAGRPGMMMIGIPIASDL
jgi:hypothetical protein